MRQDKLTSSLRRGGRCLKRQGGGGVGTILSNVLKKRSCISRTAPRLLCTLEPGEARAADGRQGCRCLRNTVGLGGMGADPGLGAFSGHPGTENAPFCRSHPRPMSLASMHGAGVREAAPASRGRVTYCAPGSLEARPPERCVGLAETALTLQVRGKGSDCEGRANDRGHVIPRVPVVCLCWGRRGHELGSVGKVQEPA